jgi:hypothetical protein
VRESLDFSNSELEHIIDEWVHSARDRAIIKRRLIDGIHYENLAEEFGLSVRQTKNIVYKCENRIFSKLK